MGLLGILIVLVVIGFVAYLFNTLVPLDPKVRQVLYAIGGLVLFLWLLCQLHIYCFAGLGARC